MPRKKKVTANEIICEPYIELIPVSREEFEKEYPTISAEDLSKAKTLDEHLKTEIKEILACEPMLSPNPIRNYPLIFKYNGDNAKQVMDFCGAFHMACHPDKLQIFFTKMNGDGSMPMPLSIFIKPGQSVVKDEDKLRVIE